MVGADGIGSLGANLVVTERHVVTRAKRPGATQSVPAQRPGAIKGQCLHTSLGECNPVDKIIYE